MITAGGCQLDWRTVWIFLLFFRSASAPAKSGSERANRWQVGANLPVIVQRAKRALERFDHDARAVHFLYGSGFGTLPSEEVRGPGQGLLGRPTRLHRGLAVPA